MAAPFTKPITPIKDLIKRVRPMIKKGEYHPFLDIIAGRIAKHGLPRKYVACFLGIGRKKLDEWCTRHPSLAAALESGEARHFNGLKKVIEAAAEKDWRAAEFLMKTLHPEVFADAKKGKGIDKPKSVRITLTDERNQKSITAEASEGRALPGPRGTSTTVEFGQETGVDDVFDAEVELDTPED